MVTAMPEVRAAVSGPTIEDFGRYHGRGPSPLWLWMATVPVMVPTRIPEDVFGRGSPRNTAGYAAHITFGKGNYNILAWADGSIWVLRRA